MGWKDRIARRGGRRVLEGANFVIYLAAVMAIVAVVNWFVDRNNQRWDLTPEQKYSLSPQSTKVVKELSKEVTIYVFDNDRGFRRHRDLLDRYAVVNPRIKVRYADPDREPTLAKQYAVRRYGTVIVAASGRHVEAQSETEEGVTNALIRALKGQKTVCFIQGHGERDLENSERTGYDRVKKQFENENYQVTSVTLLQKMEIPADCALVVIAGPRNDYLPQEIELLKKYVGGGGRLMLLVDPLTDVPNLAKLLADWNVTLRSDLVVDENPMAQVFGTRPEMPLVLSYGSSPIVEPLKRTATLFPLTRSFEVGKELKSGTNAESLCETSPDSFGVADFSPQMSAVSYRPGKDIKGPLTVAVAGTIRGEGEGKAEGRFVALGTSALAANNYLGFQGNRDLFMNMVNWLSADEDLISIRPKPPESQKLELTAQQMRRVLYLGVMGVPLFIIAAGTWVWWRRR